MYIRIMIVLLYLTAIHIDLTITDTMSITIEPASADSTDVHYLEMIIMSGANGWQEQIFLCDASTIQAVSTL